jgi:toxin ParE1/3/4
MGKSVVRGRLATRDFYAAVDHYRFTGSAELAEKFVDALEEVYTNIVQFPAAGSPRYGHMLDVTDLRSRPVTGFPFLILYAEREFTIEIFRILHTARDIPESLSEGMED